MLYIKDLYFDPDNLIIAGYEHICPVCGHVDILPLRYPRKFERYSANGEIVEYADYDGSDVDERGVIVCTKIQ